MHGCHFEFPTDIFIVNFKSHEVILNIRTVRTYKNRRRSDNMVSIHRFFTMFGVNWAFIIKFLSMALVVLIDVIELFSFFTKRKK